MMQRRQTIADNQDFMSKNQMDYWMELNRSVSLFLITTTLLGMSAMMILYAFNDDPINDILLITPENSHTLYMIPYSFRLIHIVVFLLGIFVTSCGIYGYARLNRYALAYVFSLFATNDRNLNSVVFQYGLSLILILLWLIYFSIIVVNRDQTDLARKRCFVNFKFNQKARYSIYILQNMYQCCGSKFYNYEDLVTLPKSCCKDGDDFNCPRERAWPRQCETNRTTLLSALQNSNKMIPLMIFLCAGFSLALIEAILVFYMIYRINLQLSDNIMNTLR